MMSTDREWAKSILLSLTASLNPTLVGATTVMLLLDKPARLMAGYLLGAYLTSIRLGLVIVCSASSTTNATQNTLIPAVDIAVGAIAVIAAWVVWTGRHERFQERRRARKAAQPDKGPPRWQRELSRGSPRTTFLVGMLLTLPGASYLAGLDDIHKLNYSTMVTVLIVIGFNMVMLWLLEVPLVSFLIAPEWTPRAIPRSKLGEGFRSMLCCGRALATGCGSRNGLAIDPRRAQRGSERPFGCRRWSRSRREAVRGLGPRSRPRS